jgi:hypothetical protein
MQQIVGETEEGHVFLRDFGGVAAILRFEVQQYEEVDGSESDTSDNISEASTGDNNIEETSARSRPVVTRTVAPAPPRRIEMGPAPTAPTVRPPAVPTRVEHVLPAVTAAACVATPRPVATYVPHRRAELGVWATPAVLAPVATAPPLPATPSTFKFDISAPVFMPTFFRPTTM